ncbi:carbohydrate ABC transporter permease [Diplocloster modestus]|uniref:Sugar ABC transporter permease n=1 Tax=Diplocloster modestus TaxID=2850322 RepID=A0ABS6K8Z4_9FIRM|nr:sugar ABC transporter permease [Diplocloster modestus]MBU9726995.1 sugar ABC transporter permease [Diplocloster modestus]
MKKTFCAKMIPYLFIAPTVILLAVFSYYAIGNAVFTSFTDKSSNFIGIRNYVDAFHDDMFLTSFKNQVVITVAAVFFSVFFPLLASELLFFIKHKKISGFLRTAFVIPMLVPSIVVILIWKYLYNPNFGFNTILQKIGADGWIHNWLNDEKTALFAIVLIGFPFVSGMYFLIFHSGINMIGEELYEAAIVDGATSWNVVKDIHLPNVRPYTKIVVTLSLINSLSGFGLVAATTNGGPGFATMIPALQMYKVAFGDGNFGYASALGVVLFLVIILLTMISRKLLKDGD